jgi:ribose transport system substrate-binding protein
MRTTGPSARDKTRIGRLKIVVPFVVIGLVATACSSGAKSASTGPSSGSASTAATAATASTASTAATASTSCATEAADLVKKALNSSSNDSPFPKTPVSIAGVKGKTYWVVLLSAGIPFLKLFADGVNAAAKASGASTRVADGRGTAEGAAQAINTAITAKADGIITVAIDNSVITQPLAAAAAAHIPVIDGFGGDPTAPFPSGVVGHSTPSDAVEGTIQADYALNLTSCNTHAILVASLSNPPGRMGHEGEIAELNRLCPTDCTKTVVDVQPADIATKTVTLVQNALRLNPKTNVLLLTADAYTPYVVQAEKALGLHVPIISGSGEEIAVGQTGSGPMVADVAGPPGEVIGWFFYHAMVRAAAGERSFAVEWPWALLDKTNWGTSSVPLDVQPRYKNYQQEFKKLWGLSS